MLEFRKTVQTDYADVITPDAVRALEALARFDADRKRLMDERIQRRAQRASRQQPIGFLDPESTIGGTSIKVRDARDGNFIGSEIPRDLQRQWIQGTGPAARPGASVETGIRNVAYALLSGADGWMFDGEDALGQVSTMSLDNQRNLKLAIHGDPVFMKVAEQVAGEMNAWATDVLRQTDHRRLAQAAVVHHEDFPRRAAFTSTIGTSATPAAPGSPPPSSTPPSTWSTTTNA